MKMKEESEKSGLKLNNHCGITPYHFMANKGGKVETVTDFLFLGSKITGEGNGNPLQHSCLENPTDRGD